MVLLIGAVACTEPEPEPVLVADDMGAVEEPADASPDLSEPDDGTPQDMGPEPMALHERDDLFCSNDFECYRGEFCEDGTCNTLGAGSPGGACLTGRAYDPPLPVTVGRGCLILGSRNSQATGKECEVDADCELVIYGDRCVFNVCIDGPFCDEGQTCPADKPVCVEDIVCTSE